MLWPTLRWNGMMSRPSLTATFLSVGQPNDWSLLLKQPIRSQHLALTNSHSRAMEVVVAWAARLTSLPFRIGHQSLPLPVQCHTTQRPPCFTIIFSNTYIPTVGPKQLRRTHMGQGYLPWHLPLCCWCHRRLRSFTYGLINRINKVANIVDVET